MYDNSQGAAVKRGDARQAILVATLLVVAEHGLDAVTHRRVAGLAGVSPGSTTHHFASREDLLRAAFRFYLQEAGSFLTEIDRRVQDDVPAEPLEQVKQFLCVMVEREFAHARLVRAEYELLLFASTDEELAADVRAWETRVIAPVAAALEAAGASRPVEAARTLLNFVRGYELERLLDPHLGVDDLKQRLALLLTALADQR
jgi:TetR/AcrR family transcriptional regulator, regulator of biofilm formation and stress response